jgi:hypothetical protein
MITRIASGSGQKFLIFWCPGCEQAHGPKIEGDAPWTWNSDREKPTISPSILVTYHDDRRCHSFVREGNIEFLSDCTHKLSGKTVPLPPWPYSEYGGLDPD